MYCGDETGAFIGDVGSHTARFGYGGEDCPKVVVPSASYYTSSPPSSTTAVTGSDDGRGIINSSSTLANKGRGKYSAPVSLMRIPPETFEDNDGFVPIYSSLNSNDNNQQQNSNTVSNNYGLIQDIDAWASLWEYSYSALCVRGKGKHTRGHKYHHQSELPELQPEGEGPSQTISSQSNNIDGPTIDHPLLAVDSTSRTNNIPSAVQEKQRAQMLETLFESLSAPAAYIAPSAMLSSFAYGRQTSLVVDVGHSGSRVTPIVDGYCLTNGSVSSERGGRWLGNVQQSVLEGEFKNVNGTKVVNKWNGWGDSSSSGTPPCRDGGIIPRYALHSNTKKCSKNKLQLLKQSSFHSMAVHEVMYEMMSSSHIIPLENSKEESPPFCGYGKDGESMVVENNDNDAVMEEDKKEDEDEDDIDEGPCYVLPDGTRVDLAKSKAGKDLCRLPELLFSDTLPSFMQSSTTEANSSNAVLPIHQLIHKSLNDILDVDLRKELSSNIILTGGASLIPTLDKRLSVELGEVLPSSYKYKVIGSKNTLENRYSAWIGGSILSSLGSFQQLWLSKEEYEECGAVLGLQRFKC